MEPLSTVSRVDFTALRTRVALEELILLRFKEFRAAFIADLCLCIDFL